jgi:hypothetical protein
MALRSFLSRDFDISSSFTIEIGTSKIDYLKTKVIDSCQYLKSQRQQIVDLIQRGYIVETITRNYAFKQAI